MHEKAPEAAQHSSQGNKFQKSQGWPLLSFLSSSWSRAQHYGPWSGSGLGLEGSCTSVAHQAPYRHHHFTTSIYGRYYSRLRLLQGIAEWTAWLRNTPTQFQFPGSRTPTPDRDVYQPITQSEAHYFQGLEGRSRGGKNTRRSDNRRDRWRSFVSAIPRNLIMGRAYVCIRTGLTMPGPQVGDGCRQQVLLVSFLL